jgi:hypothetical protein
MKFPIYQIILLIYIMIQEKICMRDFIIIMLMELNNTVKESKEQLSNNITTI